MGEELLGGGASCQRGELWLWGEGSSGRWERGALAVGRGELSIVREICVVGEWQHGLRTDG